MAKNGLIVFLGLSVTVAIAFQNCQPANFQDAQSSETTAQADSSCAFNGQTIADQSSVVAYFQSVVPAGETCLSQTRVCRSGSLSGTASYGSCSIAPSSSCVFNGNTIPNGGTTMAFQSSSVPQGQNCVSQQRTCNSGTLSGSYAYGNCSVAEPNYTCAAATFTVPTSVAGVTCTDTLPAYTGPGSALVFARTSTRSAPSGSGCSPSHGADWEMTTYLGTVSGGSYGTCLNYCAVTAHCTAAGWAQISFTW